MRIMDWKIPIIIFGLLAFILIPNVYAQSEREFNLNDIPKNLADALNIPEYPARLIASTCLILIFLLPTIVFTRNVYILLLVGLMSLSTCIALGWLEFWYLLIIVLVVASLWSGKVRSWLA